MILHDTVSVVVEKKASSKAASGMKILLVKRADAPEANYWAVPGGHVEKKEGIQQCAQREAREEVGAVKVSRTPVYVFIHDVGIGHRHKAHVFYGKVAGRLRASSDAKELGFFTLNQMKRMNITHYTKQILNKLYSRYV